MKLDDLIRKCGPSTLVGVLFLKLFTSSGLAQETPARLKSEACSDTAGVISDKANSKWKVEVKKLNTPEPLRTLYFIDDQDGWVASERALFRTTDGGATWKQLKLEVPAGFRISRIFFVNRSVGWASLEMYGYANAETQLWLMSTGDGGETWQAQLKQRDVFGGALSFADEQNGWLVGNSYYHQVFYYPHVFHTSNGGKTWTDVSEELLRSSPVSMEGDFPEIINVVSQSETSATISTLYGRIFTTIDGGHYWQEIKSPCARIGLALPGRILGIKGQKHLWMADGRFSMEGFWGTVYEQQEDGSWMRYSVPHFALRDALYISETQVFVAGKLVDREKGQIDGAILYSPDKGKHWTVVYCSAPVSSDGENTTMHALAAVDAAHIWGAGANGLIVHLTSN